MKKTLTAFLPVLFLLFIAGCAENSLVREKFDPGLDKINLNGILADMAETWGEPTHMMEGESRGIIELDYYKSAERTVTKTTYHKADFFDEATSESEEVRETADSEHYCFIFDKKNKFLRWYSYMNYRNHDMLDNFESGDEKYRFMEDEKLDYITGNEKMQIVKQAQAAVTGKPAQAAAPVKPANANMQARPPHNAINPLEKKLNELKSMKEKKVITAEEYARMREKLLNDFK